MNHRDGEDNHPHGEANGGRGGQARRPYGGGKHQDGGGGEVNRQQGQGSRRDSDSLGESDGERLRAAFTRAVDDCLPSSAPVGRILAAGRARRARRRLAAVTAVAASVLVAGLTVPLYRLAESQAPAGLPAPAPAPVRTGPPAPDPRTSPVPPGPNESVATLLGQGEAGGVPWSAALRFYRETPAGAPGPTVLCMRMHIGGNLVDARGGPWADCQAVHGTGDPVWQDGGAALYGFQYKGLTGARIVIAPAAPGAAAAVVALTDGGSLHATVATVPGTTYGGWAVAVPSGRHISSIRVYDAAGRLLSTDHGLR